MANHFANVDVACCKVCVINRSTQPKSGELRKCFRFNKTLHRRHRNWLWSRRDIQGDGRATVEQLTNNRICAHHNALRHCGIGFFCNGDNKLVGLCFQECFGCFCGLAHHNCGHSKLSATAREIHRDGFALGQLRAASRCLHRNGAQCVCLVDHIRTLGIHKSSTLNGCTRCFFGNADNRGHFNSDSREDKRDSFAFFGSVATSR